MFNDEEMLAIREQYEERIAAEVEKREELEWQVRRALAAIRDSEKDARKAADQMSRVHATLAALLSPGEAAPAPVPKRQPPRSSMPPRPAPKLPPPLPPASKTSASPPVRRGPLPPRELPGYRRLVA
ncbi:MAG: hypothetical protein ACHQ17_02665 [Polyangia bacterium]|jgi:outer membrane protein TolC